MISILIPIYNGIEFLNESITSVLNQTYSEWEVIIGINGHHPNSDIYLNARTYDNDKIHTYDLHTIKGKSNTLNRMVELSNYAYVAILDVDDVWLPTKLEKQVQFLQEHKFDYDVIGTHCQYFGRSHKQPNISFGKLDIRIFETVNTIINSSVIIKRELAYWDSNYESVEDYELWMRLAAQKKRFYNLSEVLVKHRIHTQSAFNSGNKQSGLIKRIKYIYYSKRFQLPSANEFMSTYMACLPED